MSVISTGTPAMGLVPRPPTTEEVREALAKMFGPRLAGYELHQVHGQRKLFNPGHRDLQAPLRGCEVFVGRLPRDLYEDELLPPFLSVGPICEMRTMMNFSGTNRGFAFVCYFTQEAARRAVEVLNNFEIRKGQPIGVVPSFNNRRLSIRPLRDVPDLRTFLYNWLSPVTDGIENISLHPIVIWRNKQRELTTSICAVVTYTSHTAAAMARRMLIPSKDEVFGHNVIIDWDDPRIEAKRPYLRKA